LASSEVLVATHALQGGYGRKHVVYDVNLSVRRSEIVALLGHNGAGKTTTMKTIFGMLPALGGRVTYAGEDATAAGCRRNVMRGMAMIPSERFTFPSLTVRENLLLGANHERSSAVRDARYARVTSLFPVLAERPAQRADTLSGGQQRMLSFGVALMSGPRLLLLDEPSLGLAPVLVTTLFDAIANLVKDEGLGVLLLEQNVGQALRIAHRVAVMRSGRVILEEPADVMRARETFWELF
jgi:branched-chain amino acid transport system ATP-binding protein